MLSALNYIEDKMERLAKDHRRQVQRATKLDSLIAEVLKEFGYENS